MAQPQKRKEAQKKKRLTDEEKEKALALHATGKSNRAIARQLDVSEGTIRRLLAGLTEEEQKDLEVVRMQQQVTFIEKAYEEIFQTLRILPDKRKEASYKDLVWGAAVLADKIQAIPYPRPGVQSQRTVQTIGELAELGCISPFVVREETLKEWEANPDAMPPELLKELRWLEKVGLIKTKPPTEKDDPLPPRWWEVEAQAEQVRKQTAQEKLKVAEQDLTATRQEQRTAQKKAELAEQELKEFEEWKAAKHRPSYNPGRSY